MIRIWAGCAPTIVVLTLAAPAILSHYATGQVLIDDFHDGDDAGWNRLDFTIGSSYGPGTFDASSQSYHLQGSGPVPTGLAGPLISLWDASSASRYQDGYVRGTIRVHTDTVAYLVLRADPSRINFYGFGLDPSNISPVFYFNRVQGGNVARSGGFDIPGELVDLEEDWVLEAGAVGSQLSMKVWKLGEPEPAVPQWMTIDNQLTAGYFGVGANHWAARPPSVVSATFDDIYFTPVPEPSGIALLWCLGIAAVARRHCPAMRRNWICLA